MLLFVKSFDYGRVRCLNIESDCDDTVKCQVVKDKIAEFEGLSQNHFKLLYDGRYVKNDHQIPDGSTVHILLCLPGGKGGFGSMLRAIGAQIEKTTNREACRDLSGRRLRDINEELRLKRWISKQAERERDIARRRRERLERLRSDPKHYFQDSNYDKQRSELPERIDSALTQGLQSSSQNDETSLKRKSKESTEGHKKRCLWLGIDANNDTDENISDCGSSDDSMQKQLPPEISSQSNDSVSCQSSTSADELSNGDKVVRTSKHGSSSKEFVPDKVEDNMTCKNDFKNSQDYPSNNSCLTVSSVMNQHNDKNFASEIINGPSISSSKINLKDRLSSIEKYYNSDDDTSTSDTYSSSSSEESENDTYSSYKACSTSQVEISCQYFSQDKYANNLNTDATSSVLKTTSVQNTSTDTSQSICINQNKCVSNDTEATSAILKQLPRPSLENTPPNMSPESLDLLAFHSTKDLELLGLDFLKSALMSLGMKCGGTLQQRAERLWLVRGIKHSEIPPSLLAKSSKPNKGTSETF